MVPTERFWPLARVWYEGRLDLDYRPRTAEEAARLFAEHGLTGAFWTGASPAADEPEAPEPTPRQPQQPEGPPE